MKQDELDQQQQTEEQTEIVPVDTAEKTQDTQTVPPPQNLQETETVQKEITEGLFFSVFSSQPYGPTLKCQNCTIIFFPTEKSMIPKTASLEASLDVNVEMLSKNIQFLMCSL